MLKHCHNVYKNPFQTFLSVHVQPAMNKKKIWATQDNMQVNMHDKFDQD